MRDTNKAVCTFLHRRHAPSSGCRWGVETAVHRSALCRWRRDCCEQAVLQDLCRSLLACSQEHEAPFTDSIASDWCMLQDLGKALGMQCVVFNCGEHLDYHFMAKFLSGGLAVLILGLQAASVTSLIMGLASAAVH